MSQHTYESCWKYASNRWGNKAMIRYKEGSYRIGLVNGSTFSVIGRGKTWAEAMKSLEANTKESLIESQEDV